MHHKTLAAFAALTLAASALPASADIRLADYPQVAGVSNQVMAVDAKLTATALDVAALKSIVVGGEAASPYLGGIRFTFNTGAGAYVPQGEDYYKSLDGAFISIQMPNERHVVPIDDLRAGTVKQVFIPCDSFVDVVVRLHLGAARYIYDSGEQIVHVRQGEIAEVSLNTLQPLNPSDELAASLRMVGRAQYYDPANTHGKQTTGESFPVQRVWDTNNLAWVTQFGYYSNSVWVTECDVYNLLPQLGDTGGVGNLDEVGDLSAAYEGAAFPWNEAQRVAFVFDDDFKHTGGQATPATNVFFFARVPIYAYKETIETLAVTNFNANGTVASVTECPLQIKWVARPEITNGYDRAFYIPPWEKIYARDYDEGTDTWTTREIGVKEANYYACYKSTPTSAKDGNWRMTGSNNYTIQSYPWPYRDGSNYGVFGISRGDLHTRAQKLNNHGFTVHNVSGTTLGAATAYFPAATNNEDMAARRWTGNNWHDYEAFRVLAYIQFSANAQATGTFRAKDGKNHAVGIYGHNNSSLAETRQDELEFYYDAQPNLLTFTIAPAASNGYPFSWLGILNFWGSEGDQMVDVTTIAETDADGTKSIWYAANLDHSRLIPNSSGTATEYSAFTSRGYERLSYYWAYTGKAGTYYRGKDEKAQYAAFGLVATTPTAADDIFNYNLNSSAYDGVYAPSSYPAQPSTGCALSYWMCSLSHSRNIAIGPWCVTSIFGPSSSNANFWGGRASPSLLEAEREARSE